MTGLLLGSLDPPLRDSLHQFLSFVGGYEWQYEALYCTLAAARTPVKNLELVGKCPTRVHLNVLARAVFFPRLSIRVSFPSIQGLDLSFPEFYAADLKSIKKVTE